MKTVIMAGGKGTRIASVASDIPKPMIPICDKPILQHQIECLKRQGLTDIVLVIGHLGSVVREYFKDGSAFGVHITYIEETVPLGTAGGLWYLKEEMTEDFLLLNGDIIFDVDFARFSAYHKKTGCAATLLTHPNGHPYDSALIVTEQKAAADMTVKDMYGSIQNSEEKGAVKKPENGGVQVQFVTDWLHREEKRGIYKNRVNSGIHILSPEIFQLFGAQPEKKDLDRDILKALIQEGKLAAYDSPEYVKDMGTPERYYAVEADMKNGVVEAKNLRNRQRAVFLDRDGTLNVYKGFLRSAEDMELLDGAAEAVRKLNESPYLVIVVTNQPVVARGECSFVELEKIHEKLETLLGMEGAYIDGLFFCPHHPDGGFAGEVAELKIDCDCRKPKPGLFYEAARQYNIDLSQSYMIGDDWRDVKAGEAAGCKKSYLLESGGKSLLQIVEEIVLPEIGGTVCEENDITGER